MVVGESQYAFQGDVGRILFSLFTDAGFDPFTLELARTNHDGLRSHVAEVAPDWTLLLGQTPLYVALQTKTAISTVHGRWWKQPTGIFATRKVFACIAPDTTGTKLTTIKDDLSTFSGIVDGTMDAQHHRIEIGRGGKPDFSLRYATPR